MQEIRKKTKPEKSMKSDKSRKSEKQEIRKSWKLEKVGNQKKQECGKSREKKKKKRKSEKVGSKKLGKTDGSKQMVQIGGPNGLVQVKTQINKVMVRTFGLVYFEPEIHLLLNLRLENQRNARAGLRSRVRICRPKPNQTSRGAPQGGLKSSKIKIMIIWLNLGPHSVQLSCLRKQAFVIYAD